MKLNAASMIQSARGLLLINVLLISTFLLPATAVIQSSTQVGLVLSKIQERFNWKWVQARVRLSNLFARDKQN